HWTTICLSITAARASASAVSALALSPPLASDPFAEPRARNASKPMTIRLPKQCFMTKLSCRIRILRFAGPYGSRLLLRWTSARLKLEGRLGLSSENGAFRTSPETLQGLPTVCDIQILKYLGGSQGLQHFAAQRRFQFLQERFDTLPNLDR